MANVDVVVRDKAGHPVVGLTKNDFELYENGVPQPITNFYEIRRQNNAPEVTDKSAPAAPEAPIELRQRRFVLFVDSTSVQPQAKVPVLNAVQKFIDRRLQPEDQMMIVSWRFGLHVVTPFTSDHAALKQGFESVVRMAPAADPTRLLKIEIQHNYDLAAQESQQQAPGYTFGQAYSDSIRAIDNHANDLVAQENALLDGLNHVESVVAGLEGKKILIFVGETLPANPGAELYRYTYDLFRQYLAPNSSIPMEVMTGVAGHQMPNRIEEVAKGAAADGVTMYAIGTADVNGELNADNNISTDSTEAFSRVANTMSALNTMASITGGVAITRTTNFDLAFNTISNDLDSYYSLGYKPPDNVSNAPRKIVVKAKNRAYSVRTRQTMMLKSADEQMSDRVIANLYSDGLPGTWEMAVRTGTPQPDGRNFIVPVEVAMAPTLTLVPEADKLAGALVVYIVVGSADGMTSEVIRRPKELRISPQEEPAIRAKAMGYTTNIRVKGGESTLSIAVLDQVSGAMGFARAKIATP